MGTKFIQHFQIEFHDTFSMTLLHRNNLHSYKNNIQKWFVFKDKLRCKTLMFFSKNYSYFDFQYISSKFRNCFFFVKCLTKNIRERYISVPKNSRFKVFELSWLYLNKSYVILNLMGIKSLLMWGFPLLQSK